MFEGVFSKLQDTFGRSEDVHSFGELSNFNHPVESSAPQGTLSPLLPTLMPLPDGAQDTEAARARGDQTWTSERDSMEHFCALPGCFPVLSTLLARRLAVEPSTSPFQVAAIQTAPRRV